MAVLAPGQAHHDLVALLDHGEVGDRLPHLAAQALGQLAGLVVGLAAIDPSQGSVHRKMERPPSTARIWPVTNVAQARKCTACCLLYTSDAADERSSVDL